MRSRIPGLALAALAASSLSWGQAPIPPKPARYLEDRARAFDAARGQALNEVLAEFERETSTQVVVYVDKKMPGGTTLEEFANRAFHEWGIGQKEKSNGLLFLVFVEDRKMRIEVGYGLEGAIPDARSHRITDETVKPFFRNGDYAGGIEAGVGALLAAARGEPYRGTGQTAARQTGSAPGRLAALPAEHGPLFWWLFLAFGIPAVTVMVVLILRPKSRRAPSRRGSWFSTGSSWSSSSSSSSDSSSSSSSSDSSSDFSGGGGDSGGGGSSDSW